MEYGKISKTNDEKNSSQEENKKKTPQGPKRIKTWTCTNMGVNDCVLVGGTHTHSFWSLSRPIAAPAFVSPSP